MKFTLSWLREHLDTDASAQEIGERLTTIGLELESLADPGAAISAFRVARVLTAERHPQADKLQVLSIDAGHGPQQVVCGAPNARAGMLGVFGPPGAYVPGADLTLKVATIRGVESRGMMCSARELGLGQEHDGIIELPADAPVGVAYPTYAGLDDPLFDVAITPNRGDCMGVHGIARDLAAAGLGTLKPAQAEPVEGTHPGFPVRIEDADGCPALWTQVVRGVRNGPSPDWLRRRLESVGQRGISLLVDITNYVMLGWGRPLHVYDLAALDGALIARRAREGETVLALNDNDYPLTPAMTVLSDERTAHDIGGIMGGKHSGVSEATTDILIECAYFDPAGIARTGQALSLFSDARARFERGVDPAFLEPGLALATRMVLDLAGGEPGPVQRTGAPPVADQRVPFDPARTATLGGLELPESEQRAILARLGFEGERDLTVPSWRHDVDGPADLVEEVVRIAGLDRIPPAPLPRPHAVARPTATPAQLTERRVRRAAASLGLHEAVTWSFIAPADADLFGGAAHALANPIAETMRVMRPSLLPGLLTAARANQDRGESSIRLFELGRRYLADGERRTLGFLLGGDARPRSWRAGPARAADPFDAKAIVLSLLRTAQAPVDKLQVLGDAPGWYHPGRSARLGLGPKTILATLGELHPAILRYFDLTGRAVAGEIYLDAIPAPRTTGRAAYAPPALQPVRRDFAFLVPADLPAGDLVRAVAGADKPLIQSARLFDLFTGEGVPEGEKSLAIEVTLQPTERTLAEADLQALSDRVVAAAAKLGARLRA